MRREHTPTGLRLFAIYVTLTDEPFIEASLESVYPFAAKIFVLTARDKTWDGTPVDPDGTLERVLEFPDPENKICCVKMWCPDEALARNWLMHAASHRLDYYLEPHAHDIRSIEGWLEPPDYFWIVDGDEIYDPASVPRILEYVRAHNARYFKVHAYVYFKTWNYRIPEPQPFTAFVRPGTFLAYARDPHMPKLLSYAHLIPRVGFGVANVLSGRRIVPPEVGVFHHPAYVATTERIARKLAHSAHRDRVMQRWIEEVWSKWTPSSRNFHPTEPGVFPRAEYVPTEELPEIIRRRKWPEGFVGALPDA